MKRATTILAAATLALTLIGTAHAATIYTTGSSGQFGTVDTDTGVYNQIKADLLGTGNTPYSLVANPAGGFYTVGLVLEGEQNYVYAVSASGGAVKGAAATAPFGSLTPYGMSYSEGIYYAYDVVNDKIGTIVPSTGDYAPIGEWTGLLTTEPKGGRLAFHGSTLYGAIYDGTLPPAEPGRFGSFNLTSGLFTQLGSASFFKTMVLASDGTLLYGLYNDGTTRSLYTVNPETGALASLGTISGTGLPSSWAGAAFDVAAVPEPSQVVAMLALSAVGGVGALLRFRRRK